MKEASGELSMTAIAVIAIGALAIIFSAVILPRLRNSLNSQTQCSNSFNCQCTDTAATCTCNYYADDGSVANGTIQCPNPNKK